jgi:hypothetical protein
LLQNPKPGKAGVVSHRGKTAAKASLATSVQLCILASHSIRRLKKLPDKTA